MELTEKQVSRIKALKVLGIQYKVIKRQLGCSLKNIKQVLKDYSLEMTEDEAIKLLLN